MLKRISGFIIIAAIILAMILIGCGTSSTPATSSAKTSIPTSPTVSAPPTYTTTAPPLATTTLPPGQEPVAIVSVVGPLPPINPGGPIVEITLKNVFTEPVIYLIASLGIQGIPQNTPYSFNFRFTPENPLLPGINVSTKQTLIGGGFSGSVFYPVTINGTLKSLATFVYTKQVLITPPAK